MTRITLILVAVICTLAGVGSIAAQSSSLQFEVATIKPVNPDGPVRVGISIEPSGRVLLSGMTLRGLVSTAFQQTRLRNASGEAWIENDAYNVQAKTPENSGITNFNHSLFDIDDASVRAMLQQLLITRFGLRVHRETQIDDVFQLTRTDKPLALRAATIPEGRNPNSIYGDIGYAGGRWVISSMTMAQLAKHASRYVVRAPVTDLTNVSGAYNYRQVVPDQDPNYSDNTDSFLRMLKDVGLELKRTRGPVETLVIDSAQRPTPD